MLPTPLTLAKARWLWHQDFDAHCSQLPPRLRIRTHKAKLAADGTLLCPARTESYYVQPKPAPSTAKDLMTDLVFMNVRALEGRNREVRSDRGSDTTCNLQEVPALSVNCKQLGKRRSLSARTIRTHVALLLQMGAITRKVWHGTRANFELWINPKYVWNTPVEVVNNIDIKGGHCQHISSIIQAYTTKFPLSVAFETLETRETAITHVDKFASPAAILAKVGAVVRRAAWEKRLQATLTRNTGLQLPATSPSQGGEIICGGPGPVTMAAVPAPCAGIRTAVSDRAATAAQQGWVKAFWNYAQPRLYPGIQFTDQQREKALRAIWQGVYRGFEPNLPPAEWQQYHQQALERLDLVAGWLTRDPSRYLPAPFAEIVRGRGYFDHENATGFRKTEDWLESKQKRICERRIDKKLRKIAADFRAWRLRNGPKWVLALTKKELWQHYQVEVNSWQNPKATEKFLRIITGQYKLAPLPSFSQHVL